MPGWEWRGGRHYAAGGINWSDLGHTALDLIGIVWDGADIINAVWYGLEGNHAMATVSAICALPFVGSLVGGSAGLALKVIGHALTFGMAVQGTWEAAGRAVEAYQNGTLSGWNFLDVGINALGMGLSGRAAFSEGRKLANRIAASEAGQKVAKGFKQLAADNRGCVDLEALKGKSTPSTTRRQAFRAAKRAAGIPESAQYIKREFVYDGTTEHRIVYEFEVNNESKFIIEHPFDRYGRGNHFHGADGKKGSPYNKGTYNQYDGHFPEDFEGFK